MPCPDDLWSPRRTELFADETTANARTSARCIICRRKARPAPAATLQLQPAANGIARQQPLSDVPPSRAEPTNAAEVGALLEAGLGVLCDSEKVRLVAGQGESPNAFHRSEYFDYAVRSTALAAFVRLAPPGLLRHKLCDLAWTRWLKDGAPPPSFLPRAADEWVYWYGQALGQHSASQEVDVLPDERRLAKRVRVPLTAVRTVRSGVRRPLGRCSDRRRVLAWVLRTTGRASL
jgi:hypothetical protein